MKTKQGILIVNSKGQGKMYKKATTKGEKNGQKNDKSQSKQVSAKKQKI